MKIINVDSEVHPDSLKVTVQLSLTEMAFLADLLGSCAFEISDEIAPCLYEELAAVVNTYAVNRSYGYGIVEEVEFCPEAGDITRDEYINRIMGKENR